MKKTDTDVEKDKGGFHRHGEIEHYSWFNLQDFKEWLRILLLAFCVVYLINTYAIVNANVPTGSMIPTITLEKKLSPTVSLIIWGLLNGGISSSSITPTMKKFYMSSE